MLEEIGHVYKSGRAVPLATVADGSNRLALTHPISVG